MHPVSPRPKIPFRANERLDSDSEIIKSMRRREEEEENEEEKI